MKEESKWSKWLRFITAIMAPLITMVGIVTDSIVGVTIGLFLVMSIHVEEIEKKLKLQIFFLEKRIENQSKTIQWLINNRGGTS